MSPETIIRESVQNVLAKENVLLLEHMDAIRQAVNSVVGSMKRQLRKDNLSSVSEQIAIALVNLAEKHSTLGAIMDKMFGVTSEQNAVHVIVADTLAGRESQKLAEMSRTERVVISGLIKMLASVLAAVFSSGGVLIAGFVVDMLFHISTFYLRHRKRHAALS